MWFRLRSLRLCGVVIGLSMLMTPAPAKAARITIHDLTDTVTVIAEDDQGHNISGNIQVLPDSFGEKLHFKFGSTQEKTGGQDVITAHQSSCIRTSVGPSRW